MNIIACGREQKWAIGRTLLLVVFLVSGATNAQNTDTDPKGGKTVGIKIESEFNLSSNSSETTSVAIQFFGSPEFLVYIERVGDVELPRFTIMDLGTRKTVSGRCELSSGSIEVVDTNQKPGFGISSIVDSTAKEYFTSYLEQEYDYWIKRLPELCATTGESDFKITKLEFQIGHQRFENLDFEKINRDTELAWRKYLETRANK